MTSILELLDYFRSAHPRRYEPVDGPDRETYALFQKVFSTSAEIQRRGAADAHLFEQGYHENGIDTELPIVVYFDTHGNPVSHEIYRGRLPAMLMKARWRDRSQK